MADGAINEIRPNWGQGNVVFRNGQYYMTGPYGAQPLRREDAATMAAKWYRENSVIGLGGGAGGGRAAQRQLDRGLGQLRTRRALGSMAAAQNMRDIRRSGKGALLQAQGDGSLRGAVGQLPAEYLSRMMGRQLSTADIAQAQAMANFRGEEADLRNQYQTALARNAQARAAALDAQTREEVLRMLEQGMPNEAIASYLGQKG